MKSLVLVLVFFAGFAAPAWGDYEKGQGMPQEYVRAYTFAAAKNKSNVTVQKPSNFSNSQMWRSIMGNERKTLPAGRKPLPPGWILVATEWKIAE